MTISSNASQLETVAVEKQTLTVRFAHGFFQEQYKMTIGVEFAVKLIEIGGFKTKLQIWDTGGQERFSYVRPLYYKGAMGALCVFDLCNRESFDHVPNWIDEVKTNVGEVPMVLVGNKADLPGREVPREECEACAKKFNMYYLESSAKTGDGVSDCFGVLAAMMIGIEPPAELLSPRPEGEISPSIETLEIPSVPPVPERIHAQESFASKKSASNRFAEVPLVPEPPTRVAPVTFSDEDEFGVPPIPEPHTSAAPPVLIGEEDELGVPPVPEFTAPTKDFEAPPVPPPSRGGKKFVPLADLMGDKGTPKPASKMASPKPISIKPVKPIGPTKEKVKSLPATKRLPSRPKESKKRYPHRWYFLLPHRNYTREQSIMK